MASVYAASKAGVVAFSESLRRELDPTGVNVMHLITPGVDTGMLDATEDKYGEHFDTSSWDKIAPDEWAAEDDRRDQEGCVGAAPRRQDPPGDPRLTRPGRPARSGRFAHVPALSSLRRKSAAPAGLGVQALPDEDPALDEPRLAVREVEIPQPREALVVAVAAQLLEVRVEALAPAAQRLGVVRGDVLEADQLHVGVALDRRAM